MVAQDVRAVNLSQRHTVVVIIAVLLLIVAALVVGVTQRTSTSLQQTHTGERGSLSSVLLSGAAGGVIVFILTTTAGVVVRTRQQGRELRGMSRVLWPEMKRNWLAVGSLKTGRMGRNVSEDDHPIREAWLDTRTKLSQLMREKDFDTLAKYYADLAVLEAAVTNNLVTVTFYAGKAQDHEIPALKVVEEYRDARWRPWPFRGYGPGPLKGGSWTSSLLIPLASQPTEEAPTEDAPDKDAEN
jgi:hypothetical protein